jgi:predicted Zn finger-like uncharacterized protein
MTASKAFYQCSHCGTVHKIEDNKIEVTDELYSSVWCSHCKAITKQLWVGDKPEEIYELYSATLDSRFYNYNKTK